MFYGAWSWFGNCYKRIVFVDTLRTCKLSIKGENCNTCKLICPCQSTGEHFEGPLLGEGFPKNPARCLVFLNQGSTWILLASLDLQRVCPQRDAVVQALRKGQLTTRSVDVSAHDLIDSGTFRSETGLKSRLGLTKPSYQPIK